MAKSGFRTRYPWATYQQRHPKYVLSKPSTILWTILRVMGKIKKRKMNSNYRIEYLPFENTLKQPSLTHRTPQKN